MKHLFTLALKSAWNRRYTLSLTLFAVTLSVVLLLGVERARVSAQDSFAHTVSQTDLIVGARTSPLQLLLYAVFHLGEATNEMDWNSFQDIAHNPDVAWALPISLGDSHRGFPVLGTSKDYFTLFHYGDKQSLQFTAGHPFEGIFDTVLGADVAAKLNYHLGDKIILSHGLVGEHLLSHADKPFTVVGILAPTGTPVDRTVHVSVEAITAIHLDWQGGAPIPGFSIPEQYVTKFHLTPKTITAALIGLKSRVAVFRVQRDINTYKTEPLLAVLPGVALDQLWEIMSVAERSLLFITTMVIVVSLAGLAAVLLAGLSERRRELAILRSVGARPWQILSLVLGESVLISTSACIIGLMLLDAITWIIGPWIRAHYGLTLSNDFVSSEELLLLIAVVVAAVLTSLIPAIKAYRQTLADGLTPRI